MSTGVVADSCVHDATHIGNQILQSMAGHNVLQYSFRKKMQAINLTHKNIVKIASENVQIDPQLLFQRLVIAGERTENLSELLKYELCSYAPALFENPMSLHYANKAVLADALCEKVGDIASCELPRKDLQYVLDGGALLH